MPTLTALLSVLLLGSCTSAAATASLSPAPNDGNRMDVHASAAAAGQSTSPKMESGPEPG
jgi:hypothetical protein